ncbi:MAG TPA: prolipoprotein diacylglyceryl transferase family protein [Polyangiales bacterium]|nr:prolipoprotein diacylglyceryl transferase family protein [Polyangiales bacterium]
MPASLFIPWFRLESWDIPLPVSLPILGDTLSIQPFGVLVATGVLLGAWIAGRFARRNGLDPVATGDLVTYAVVTGFILGYLLNGLFYERDTVREILQDPSLFFSTWLGLSSYGGFFGGILGCFIWRYRTKMPLLPYANAVCFALPFGWFFGRMGCFVVHDHPGKVTDFALAVADYRFGTPPYEPRHDLGLYELIYSALIIALFVWLEHRRRRPVGFYCALLPLLYAPVRFFLDFLRATPLEGGDARYAGLTPAQWSSVLMVFIGLAVWQLGVKPRMVEGRASGTQP